MTNFVSTAAWALARKEKSLFKNKAKVTEFCHRRSDSQQSSPLSSFSHLNVQFDDLFVGSHFPGRIHAPDLQQLVLDSSKRTIDMEIANDRSSDRLNSTCERQILDAAIAYISISFRLCFRRVLASL